MPWREKSSALKPLKILIVEDNLDCADLTKTYLKEIGVGQFESVRAASLEAALECLSKGGIELILLDLTLPDSKGLGTLKKVHAAVPAIPVIVYTGYGRESMIADAMRAGAQDYLVKGEIDSKRLLRAIQYSIERQNATTILRESEERYRRLVETAGEGIWVTDAENKLIFVNQKMADLLGYTVDEMRGQLLYSFMDNEARKIAMKNMEQHRGEIGEQRKQKDFCFRQKSGINLWVLSATTQIADKEGRHVGMLGMVTDMTERKDLELRLLQSQKLEAVGRLAGGVAHDFNNLLTAILGYCKFLEASMEPADARLNDLKEIANASNRAAALTHQLLAFSRRQVLAPKVLNLNTIIANMEGMLKRVIGEDLNVSTTLDQKLENVKADSGQIEQVVMNLVVNARDAMPKGGRISIETMNVKFNEDSLGRHDVIPIGTYVMIAVSDTGSGMDLETQSHIFEPFFTTKELGKGTGLGLSTVYGIAKQSGGYIWVYSEIGQGTTFKIYLPVSLEPVKAVVADNKVPSKTLRGSETILLAEDDASVRHMLCRTLGQSGYTVIPASNGKEAISIIEQRANEINLILTDIVMPEVGGRGLADYVNLVCPKIKIIFMSGYTDDVIIRHGSLDPGMIFIQKPIASDALLQKIRYALDMPSKRKEFIENVVPNHSTSSHV